MSNDFINVMKQLSVLVGRLERMLCSRMTTTDEPKKCSNCQHMCTSDGLTVGDDVAGSATGEEESKGGEQSKCNEKNGN